jgi:hypothetical protein
MMTHDSAETEFLASVISGSAWRVLRLRKVERPPVWWVAENILDKQSRTADKG